MFRVIKMMGWDGSESMHIIQDFNEENQCTCKGLSGHDLACCMTLQISCFSVKIPEDELDPSLRID